MPVLESPCFTPRVTHIAFIIGYRSVSYFISYCRGCSPVLDL